MGMGKRSGVWLCEGNKGARPNSPAISSKDRWGRGCRLVGG